MNINKAHCFFEQSGTFKREFIRLGIRAEDYDILNEFGETDHIVDLFGEIDLAFKGGRSVFDAIGQDELIFAFFPCVYFAQNSMVILRGDQYQQRNQTDRDKLITSMQRHEKLSRMYQLISRLALVCIDRQIPLIIENPFMHPHYLTDHWPIRPSVIDKDRTINGDYYRKPTQYWFIGIEPENNFIFEPIEAVQRRVIEKETDTVQRSMIHPQYANRFIRKHILNGE